jgi:F420-non-reducing hydrogenase small subunit
MPTIAIENFAVCTGCEVAVLDLGDTLLQLLPQLDFVHCQVLMDHKWFGQRGEGKHLEVVPADIGIVTGGVRTEEDRHIALELRKKVKILISLGACAVHGGIPALANLSTKEELMTDVYSTHTTEKDSKLPGVNIPPLEKRVYALDEVVKVDVQIPGCPPHPDVIGGAVLALLQGKPWSLPERSVCDDCPTIREKKGPVAVRRPLQNPERAPGAPISQMRCFNEQGIICNGPVTKAGCRGEDGLPRCVKANMPCRGCFGPIRSSSMPYVDMVNALVSNGIDIKTIDDRMGTFNRYIGGHERLKVHADREAK